MSLKDDLKELKRQKKAELQNLHHTYVYTKRDIKRAASPDRFIRKHITPTLGIAAIVGLLLAPRPAARVKVVKEKVPAEGAGNSIGSHVRQLIRNALQQAERLVPPPKGAHNGDGAAAKPPKKPGAGFVGTLLAAMLSRIDLQKIVAELTRQYMAKMKGRTQDGTAGGPGSPQVSVADAGTVKPTDYEDLQ